MIVALNVGRAEHAKKIAWNKVTNLIRGIQSVTNCKPENGVCVGMVFGGQTNMIVGFNLMDTTSPLFPCIDNINIVVQCLHLFLGIVVQVLFLVSLH
ncbi:hypothetical protein Nepgr_008729 [Nepenthes gracilis]|uniref:Uncharacterized protein n=1 Tax=Nepenthes gracilis TaxID=150966 RepID=A0AAD3S9M6_NEPGR|nr:hypothetical protein Nepgr_008729 [Nepenthes gracilis]